MIGLVRYPNEGDSSNGNNSSGDYSITFFTSLAVFVLSIGVVVGGPSIGHALFLHTLANAILTGVVLGSSGKQITDKDVRIGIPLMTLIGWEFFLFSCVVHIVTAYKKKKRKTEDEHKI